MKKLRKKKLKKYLTVLSVCVLSTCVMSVIVMAFKYDMAIDIKISPVVEFGIRLIGKSP